MQEIRTKCGLVRASLLSQKDGKRRKRTVVRARKVIGIAVAYYIKAQ